jgi:hypothetical protein
MQHFPRSCMEVRCAGHKPPRLLPGAGCGLPAAQTEAPRPLRVSQSRVPARTLHGRCAAESSRQRPPVAQRRVPRLQRRAAARALHKRAGGPRNTRELHPLRGASPNTPGPHPSRPPYGAECQCCSGAQPPGPCADHARRCAPPSGAPLQPPATAAPPPTPAIAPRRASAPPPCPAHVPRGAGRPQQRAAATVWPLRETPPTACGARGTYMRRLQAVVRPHGSRPYRKRSGAGRPSKVPHQ